MSDIVAFLTARLDEDEADARAAIADRSDTERWEAKGFPERDRVEWIVRDVEEKYASHGYPGHTAVASAVPGGPRDGGGVAAHIARHDPARVLREVKAKRAIVADHPVWPPLEMTERELHEHYAHPAYEYATTEGRRKAWDNADEPPEGEGWERNIDAGRNGWERFDYTEESYWRRLNPEGPQPWRPPLVLRHLAAVYADHPDYEQGWSVE